MPNKGNKRIYVILLCEILIIAFIHLFNIDKLYGFYLGEDELGYWGNAAFLGGKDWGNTVSYCPYYSFGYSFFLVLILSLPLKATTIYQLAIVSNVIFLIISFFISNYLVTHLFPNKNKVYISFVCTVMSLYVSFISQSSIAWSECYLILFVWLILLQSYLICNKVTIIRIILFAVELGYIYMIHQRTIPFVIAGVLLIVLLTVLKKVRLTQLLTTLIVLLGMIFLSIAIKNHLQSSIYAGENLQNDYSSVFKGMNLSNLLVPVLWEAIGQIYYLWSSSFGIIPLGIGIAIAVCIKAWKQKNVEFCFWLFAIVSFLGILGVSSIFMRLGTKRVDCLIYGRYNEIAVGFFIVIGILGIADFVKKKRSLFILCSASICYIGMALLVMRKVQAWDVLVENYIGVCAAGTYWFYSIRGFQVLELSIIIVSIIGIFFGVAKIVPFKVVYVLEIIIIAVFWVVAGKVVIKDQVYPYQIENQELSTKEELWKNINDKKCSVVFLSNTRHNDRGVLQLNLLDTPLVCIEDLAELNYTPDIIIVDNDESVIDPELFSNYRLVCFLGRKGVYSLIEIDLGNVSQELDENIFIYNQVLEGDSGYVMYGPYIKLAPGLYEVTFEMSANIDGQDVLGIMDIVSNYGQNIMCSSQWNGNTRYITMSFTVEDTIEDLEIRYYKNAGNAIVPVKVMINGK